MNIQIFGTKKCNDTKKAQRYYKERGIKFQFIDMNEKETRNLASFLFLLAKLKACKWLTGGILTDKHLKFSVFSYEF